MRFGVKPPCCRRTGDVRVRTEANSRAGAAAAQSPPFIALPAGAGPRRQWRRSCARSRTRATGGALTSPRPPRVARPSHHETSRPDHRATARAPVRQRSRLAAARGSTSWLVWSQSSSTVGDLPATRDQDLEPDVGSCSAGSNRKRRAGSRPPMDRKAHTGLETGAFS